MSTIAKTAALFLLILTCAQIEITDAQTRRRIVSRVHPPCCKQTEAKHYRGGPARSGVYDTTGPRSLAGTKWQTQASSSFNAPVYANGALYLNDGTGREMAVDAETGATRWRTSFLSAIISSPTIMNDVVYIGIDGHAVLALSASDGHQVARFDVDSEVFASPLIEDDTLYVATESGALYAFDITTHEQKWRFVGAGPAHGHPAAWHGVVYYGSGGALIAVDNAGHEKWRFAGPSAFFSPSLAVADGAVFGSSANNIYALDAETGATKWTYSASSPATGFSAPSAWNGLVIFGTIAPNALIAFNESAGTLVWQTPLPDFTEPILADGALYGGTGDYSQAANPNAQQKVYAFDALSGQQLWSANVTGQVKTGAAVGDGKLFIHTQARNLYAFD
jgi:eukaryotic-like serine/threonine-protein kinase